MMSLGVSGRRRLSVKKMPYCSYGRAGNSVHVTEVCRSVSSVETTWQTASVLGGGAEIVCQIYALVMVAASRRRLVENISRRNNINGWPILV